MSLAELLPIIHDLPRADKLRLMQMLVVDIAGEEGVTLFAAPESYPVWSPYGAFDAAAAMLRLLEEDRRGET